MQLRKSNASLGLSRNVRVPTIALLLLSMERVQLDKGYEEGPY
jgi:hypothetical protein